MENDQLNGATPSYWNSVLIAGIITAIVYSALGILSSYMMLKSSSAYQALGIFVCLISSMAGVIANRHYAKEFDISYSLGKGALIGFLAAIVAVIVGTVISLIWTTVIDPGLNDAVYQAQISAMEAQGMSQEQIDMALSFSPEPGSTTAVLMGVGIGILGLGIVNVISGIISAKIFASEE